MNGFNTRSGGFIEVGFNRNMLNGDKYIIHIDQSTNLNNGEGDATIDLTSDEIKGLISLLNNFIINFEGAPFVVEAAPLLHPDVKILYNDQEVSKDPKLVNPFLEDHIEIKEYFNKLYK